MQYFYELQFELSNSQQNEITMVLVADNMDAAGNVFLKHLQPFIKVIANQYGRLTIKQAPLLVLREGHVIHRPEYNPDESITVNQFSVMIVNGEFLFDNQAKESTSTALVRKRRPSLSSSFSSSDSYDSDTSSVKRRKDSGDVESEEDVTERFQSMDDDTDDSFSSSSKQKRRFDDSDDASDDSDASDISSRVYAATRKRNRNF